MVIGLVIITFFTQLLGFLRDSLISFYYGASAITDAYVISTVIPMVIIGVVASGVSSVYIPTYNRILEQSNDESESKNFTISLLFTLLVIGFLCAAVILLKPDVTALIFANGFSGESLNWFNQFVIVTSFSMPIILMNNLLVSYFQIKSKFILSAFFSIPSNILGIFLVYFSFLSSNPLVLPYCYLFTMLLQFLLLFICSKLYIVDVIAKFKFSTHEVSTSIMLALPVMLGVSLNQINFMVDRSLATTLVTGSVTFVNLAVRVNSVVEAVIITSIIAVFYPVLSKTINNKRMFSGYFLELLLIGVLVIIPLSCVLFLFSYDIVDLLFGRGQFNTENIEITSKLLSIYSIMLPFIYLKTVISKFMYALGHYKLPSMIGAVGVAINISLNFILIKHFEVLGLAIATVISSIITTIILGVFFIRHKLVNITRYNVICLLKIIPFSIVPCFIINWFIGGKIYFIFEIMIILLLCISMSYIYSKFIFRFSYFMRKPKILMSVVR